MNTAREWVSPSQGQNRSRKILIAIAGVLLFLVLLESGWAKYTALRQDLETEIELKSMELEKQLRIVGQRQTYEQKNTQLKELKQEIANTRLLQGETPALAEAKLQNLVNEFAQDTKVNIMSMRMLPRKKENMFTALTVGINGRAEIGAIKDFLYQLAQVPQFVHVLELEIKIVNRREERYFNISAQITALAQV